ncbi:CHAD domain-containing protein [Rhizobium sp. BE258]|uniref:CHAD domain-containing protein n=1 Tax=Rhizobium sp. BE258 TaxID=2817722 RepID=UPI002863DF82|nr:CHAD domain-containing protein [Rhizobium sp. BE258]MDR7146079.1 CHAD domain-containing protein [Rhizobium sp. BE258]
MPFRIRPDADFTESFKDAAAGELLEAIRMLEQRPDGTHEAIHAFRKNLKKVRSLYRLVAREMGAIRKRENIRLRDAARALSTIRDAEALIETVRYLQSHARDEDERASLERIAVILETRRNWMTEAEAGIEPKLLETSGILKEAIAALDGLSFPGKRDRTAKLIAKGWERTAAKARAALDACHGEASDSAFHELRKRTQDYRANHKLLTVLWPTAMKAKRDAAKALVDRLGHVHDLSVLSDLVEAEPQLFTRNDDLARLLDAIIHRQQDDRREALVMAETIFADDPGEEARRIRLLWRAAAK